jgi:hypothetical protein
VVQVEPALSAGDGGPADRARAALPCQCGCVDFRVLRQARRIAVPVDWPAGAGDGLADCCGCKVPGSAFGGPGRVGELADSEVGYGSVTLVSMPVPSRLTVPTRSSGALRLLRPARGLAARLPFAHSWLCALQSPPSGPILRISVRGQLGEVHRRDLHASHILSAAARGWKSCPHHTQVFALNTLGRVSGPLTLPAPSAAGGARLRARASGCLHSYREGHGRQAW